MKEKHGEYILLYWDGDVEGYYIKGHVTDDEAISEIQRQEEFTPSRFAHKYARWTFADKYTPEGCDHTLKVYDKPQRGAFKITACDEREGV